MYKISATEERNEKATEYETKSMLYMMNYYTGANKIEYFAIDFFNDVSGINKLADTCYDVQSKGIKNITPYALGQYLVTLFKNYLSEFNFEEFILFVEGVNSEVHDIIGDKEIFDISDLTEPIITKIKDGLTKSAEDKSYIEDKSKINKENINIFLQKVIFVIDIHSKEEYIKDAVQIKSSLIIDDKDLRKIFKEIRDKQSSKKNNNLNGTLLNSIGCLFNYDKYLSKEDIQQLIINRICFKTAIREMNNHNIPKTFLKCLHSIDELIVDDVIESCQNDIFKLLFDKNNKEYFWDLFEEIVLNIKQHPDYSVNEIYDIIDKNKVIRVNHLGIMSCKYYISLIKERIA